MVLEVRDACKGKPHAAKRVRVDFENLARYRPASIGLLRVNLALKGTRPSACSNDLVVAGLVRCRPMNLPFFAHFGSTSRGSSPLSPSSWEEASFEYIRPSLPPTALAYCSLG